MAKRIYNKSEKWLAAKKIGIFRQRIKNAPRNVEIYKSLTALPIITAEKAKELCEKYHLTRQRLNAIKLEIKGMVERKEIDISLF